MSRNPLKRASKKDSHRKANQPAAPLRVDLGTGDERMTRYMANYDGRPEIVVKLPGFAPAVLGDIAVVSFNSANASDRFCGLLLYLVELVTKEEVAGASLEKQRMGRALTYLLIEAMQGNYSNSLWPDDTSKRGRQTSFNKAQAVGGILGLIRFKMSMDGCESWQAASRVAYEIDDRLKSFLGQVAAAANPDAPGTQTITLADWVPRYGDGKSAPGDLDMDGDRPAHALTGRLTRWLKAVTPDAPKSATPPPGFSDANGFGRRAFEAVSLLGQQAQAKDATAAQSAYFHTLEATVRTIIESCDSPADASDVASGAQPPAVPDNK